MNIKNSFGKAQVLFRQGEFEESSSLCKKILSKKPKFSDVIHLLALNYKAMNQPELAIKEFKKAIAINNKIAAYFNNLANVYLEKKSFTEASYFLEKSLALDPYLPQANHNLSACLFKQKNFERAEFFCKKAIQHDSINPEYYLSLGTIYYEQGLFDNASQAFLSSLERHGKGKTGNSTPKAYIEMFNLQVSRHCYQDAIEIADIGISSQQLTDQELCTLLIGKAIIYLLFHYLEEARQAIELSQKIYQFAEESKELTNMAVFHRYIATLLDLRNENTQAHLYSKSQAQKNMYFISESHGFAPNGTLINYKNEQYKIKSLFIMGTKIIHLITQDDNKFHISLSSLLETLEPESKVIIAFGEIDCRLDQGIYAHSLKYSKDYNDVIEDMLPQYISLLNNIATSLNIEIIVYGVPSPNPCVFDNCNEETEIDFKKMIKKFNSQLRKECLSNEISFLDVYQLTDENGKSNLEYHIDSYHVSPDTVPTLFESMQ